MSELEMLIRGWALVNKVPLPATMEQPVVLNIAVLLDHIYTHAFGQGADAARDAAL